MRIAKKIWLLSLILGFSNNAFAYYCSSPKGNGYIKLTDSMQSIEKVCGKPDNVFKQVIGGPKEQEIQYWTYTAQPVAKFSPPYSQPPAAANVTFVIINNKVASISNAGKNVKTSNLCRTGMMVRVGQDAQRVLANCGSPTDTDRIIRTIPETKQDAIIWVYDTPNKLPTMLTFIGGKLRKVSP